MLLYIFLQSEGFGCALLVPCLMDFLPRNKQGGRVVCPLLIYDWVMVPAHQDKISWRVTFALRQLCFSTRSVIRGRVNVANLAHNRRV